MTVHAVFFDLGDTLVEIKPEVYIDLTQRITVESERNIEVDDLQIAIKDEWYSRNGEDIQWVNTDECEIRYWREFYRNVLERLGVNAPSQSLIGLLAHRAADPDSFACFEDVEETLTLLKHKGIRTGLISNAFPSARPIIDKIDLTHWFNPVVFSYEYTCAKPCPEIYRYALECAQIKPEQALFVDDRVKFLNGAIQLGMQASVTFVQLEAES